MFSVKFATGIIDKVLHGDSASDAGGILGTILARKLEGMGEDLIMDYIGGPMGTAQRVSQAVRTGGQSEFDRTRDQFLNALKPRALPHQGLINKIGGAFQARARRARRYRPGTWQASSWAASREDWLQNRWHHDWRSQPRDERGRWIPGRLDFIAAQLQYRGKRPGRTTLRRRKRRKLRRLMTRREAKKMFSKRMRDGY